MNLGSNTSAGRVSARSAFQPSVSMYGRRSARFRTPAWRLRLLTACKWRITAPVSITGPHACVSAASHNSNDRVYWASRSSFHTILGGTCNVGFALLGGWQRWAAWPLTKLEAASIWAQVCCPQFQVAVNFPRQPTTMFLSHVSMRVAAWRVRNKLRMPPRGERSGGRTIGNYCLHASRPGAYVCYIR